MIVPGHSAAEQTGQHSAFIGSCLKPFCLDTLDILTMDASLLAAHITPSCLNLSLSCILLTVAPPHANKSLFMIRTGVHWLGSRFAGQHFPEPVFAYLQATLAVKIDLALHGHELTMSMQC